jgi:hypothetical protein
VFPLKWLTQAMRSAFLPDGAQVAEIAGSWERVECALILVDFLDETNDETNPTNALVYGEEDDVLNPADLKPG